MLKIADPYRETCDDAEILILKSLFFGDLKYSMPEFHNSRIENSGLILKGFRQRSPTSIANWGSGIHCPIANGTKFLPKRT